MNKLLCDANNVYTKKMNSVYALMQEVGEKSNEKKLYGCRNLDDASIFYAGLATKCTNLSKRLKDLQDDWDNTINSINNDRYSKWFGWLPFIYLSRKSKHRLQKFIDDWSKQEPGW